MQFSATLVDNTATRAADDVQTNTLTQGLQIGLFSSGAVAAVDDAQKGNIAVHEFGSTVVKSEDALKCVAIVIPQPLEPRMLSFGSFDDKRSFLGLFPA